MKVGVEASIVVLQKKDSGMPTPKEAHMKKTLVKDCAIEVPDWLDLGTALGEVRHVERTFFVPYHGYSLITRIYPIRWKNRPMYWVAGLLTGGDTSENLTYDLVADKRGLSKYVKLMQKEENVLRKPWVQRTMPRVVPEGWTGDEWGVITGPKTRTRFVARPVIQHPGLISLGVIRNSADGGTFLMNLDDAKKWILAKDKKFKTQDIRNWNEAQKERIAEERCEEEFESFERRG